MYLKNLYRQSRPWFVVVLAFMAGQLLVNLKRGMVFSPFYHYGMYSEKMQPRAAYPVFEVVADTDTLRAKDFSSQQWDKLMLPLVYFNSHRQWNQEMYATLHRLTGISDSTNYTNPISKRGFYNWYQGYLSTILHRPVKSVLIQQKTYSPGR